MCLAVGAYACDLGVHMRMQLLDTVTGSSEVASLAILGFCLCVCVCTEPVILHVVLAASATNKYNFEP